MADPEGAPSPKVGAPTYYISQILKKKLHKNEKNKIDWGGGDTRLSRPFD